MFIHVVMYIVYRTFQVSPAVGGRIVPGSAVGSGTGASLVVTSCVVGADATTLTPAPVLAPVLELGTRLPSAGVRKENTNWKKPIRTNTSNIASNKST